MSNVHQLACQLTDRRSKKVVFLAHCLLNENTRYLGGACRGCCVREIVEQCITHDLGMVQMPCPECHDPQKLGRAG
jgi:predicted secreted protein